METQDTCVCDHSCVCACMHACVLAYMCTCMCCCSRMMEGESKISLPSQFCKNGQPLVAVGLLKCGCSLISTDLQERKKDKRTGPCCHPSWHCSPLGWWAWLTSCGHLCRTNWRRRLLFALVLLSRKPLALW